MVYVFIHLMFSDLSDSQRPERIISYNRKLCFSYYYQSQNNILKFWQKGIMSQMYEIDSKFHLDIKHNKSFAIL
jgi:hypothetical protein